MAQISFEELQKVVDQVLVTLSEREAEARAAKLGIQMLVQELNYYLMAGKENEYGEQESASGESQTSAGEDPDGAGTRP